MLYGNSAQHYTLLIVIITLVCVRPTVSHETKCPASCRCIDGTAVKCSDTHLEELPSDLNGDLTWLDLSRNNLTSLPEDAFQDTPGLHHLKLASNKISEIHENTFNILKNLSSLALQDNRLTTLHPDSFVNTNLRVLTLSWNDLTLPEEGPFLRVSGLNRLYLDHCNLTHLPDAMFSGATNISHLQLNGNSITTINGEVFRPLTQLIFISLTNNGLVNLHQDTFRYNPQLLQIDLTDNAILIPEDGFLNTCVNILSLGGNGLTYLPDNTFRDLSRVEVLYLHNNSISELEINVWKHLPKLTDLLIYNNNVTSFDENVFSENEELQRLSLRNNMLQFTTGPILNSASLTLLDIRSCNLSYLPPSAFDGMPALEVLALGENNFQDIDINLFDSLGKLQQISLSDSPVVCSCFNEDLQTWASQRGITLRAYCQGDTVKKETCNGNDVSTQTEQ